MKWSWLVLLITLAEAGLIAAGHLSQNYAALRLLLVHGSPVSMFMHLLGGDSIFWERSPAMIAMAIGHVVKYALFCLAQLRDDVNGKLYIAVFLEAVYLAYSAYWLIF